MSESELDGLLARSLDPAPMTYGEDVPGEDGRRGQRPRRPHRPGLQGLRQRGQDRLQDVRARPQDLGRQDDQGRD